MMNTVISGAADYMHFLFVFLLMFFAYVATGHLLLGHRMVEFAAWRGTLGYCLQIVYQREFNIAAFIAEDMFMGVLWTATFIMVVVVVMVGLFLAILFEHYSRSSHASELYPSIMSTAADRLKRFRSSNRFKPAREMMVAISKLPVNDFWTLAKLKDHFQGQISGEQLEAVWKYTKLRVKGHAKKNQMMLEFVIAHILLAIRDLREGIRFMNRKSDRYSHISQGSAPSIESSGTAYSGCFSIEEEDDAFEAMIADEDTLGNLCDPPGSMPFWLKDGVLSQLQANSTSLVENLKKFESRWKELDLADIPAYAGGRPAGPGEPVDWSEMQRARCLASKPPHMHTKFLVRTECAKL